MTKKITRQWIDFQVWLTCYEAKMHSCILKVLMHCIGGKGPFINYVDKQGRGDIQMSTMQHKLMVSTKGERVNIPVNVIYVWPKRYVAIVKSILRKQTLLVIVQFSSSKKVNNDNCLFLWENSYINSISSFYWKVR